MREPTWVTKLKNKWNIANNRDFTFIMLAFSLAGMSICVVRPILFKLLHIEHAPLWIKVLIYPVLVIPSYYCGFLLFGALLGQFKFCWRFTGNSIQRLGRLYTRLTTGTASNK